MRRGLTGVVIFVVVMRWEGRKEAPHGKLRSPTVDLSSVSSCGDTCTRSVVAFLEKTPNSRKNATFWRYAIAVLPKNATTPRVRYVHRSYDMQLLLIDICQGINLENASLGKLTYY